MNLLDLARSALASEQGETPTPTVAPGHAAELRELVGIITADWTDDERTEAMEAALADPEAALICYRALVAERGGASASVQQPALAEMRPCVDCANYTPSGRCLAAWRGELPGFARSYAPAMTDRPQRCAGYQPGPDDPDRRTGRERWPWIGDGGMNAAR